MIQELIVAIIIGFAGAFIIMKFFLKKKDKGCDKCGMNNENK